MCFLYANNSTSKIHSSSHLLLAFLQVIRPFILRRKKDEVEKYLPSKTQVILKCDLSAWQKIYYQQVTEMGRVGLAHGKELLLALFSKEVSAPLTNYFFASILSSPCYQCRHAKATYNHIVIGLYCS